MPDLLPHGHMVRIYLIRVQSQPRPRNPSLSPSRSPSISSACRRHPLAPEVCRERDVLRTGSSTGPGSAQITNQRSAISSSGFKLNKTMCRIIVVFSLACHSAKSSNDRRPRRNDQARRDLVRGAQRTTARQARPSEPELQRFAPRRE